MQTILGANGVIARELSRALEGTDRIRQVSRHPQRVNPSDEDTPQPICSMHMRQRERSPTAMWRIWLWD